MEYQKHKTRTSIVIDLKKLKMAWINGVCPTSHYQRKVMVEGHNQRQGPPPLRNTFRIFRKELIEHHDLSRFIKYPTVHGVRGVNNAPPSGQIRKKSNVYEFIHRKNQKKSISI